MPGRARMLAGIPCLPLPLARHRIMGGRTMARMQKAFRVPGTRESGTWTMLLRSAEDLWNQRMRSGVSVSRRAARKLVGLPAFERNCRLAEMTKESNHV
jgi:hypothetical protein